MLDIQLLRSHPKRSQPTRQPRRHALDVAGFQALEDERKPLQTRTQELQAKRNALSKQIGQLKAKGEDAGAVMQEVAGIGDDAQGQRDANSAALLAQASTISWR